MATSKTLTPTNVTIQIPAFTDKPDQRANSNCIDKEADAINALSDQMGHTDVEEDISVTIQPNSTGVLVNRSLAGCAPSGKTIKALSDVYCPGVAGYICPAIGDNGTNLIIRGYNCDTTARTVTKIKYRIWYT